MATCPEAGLEHDCTQVSLSHSETKLHGGIRTRADQGVARPVTGVHSSCPRATGTGRLNFPSSNTWRSHHFYCLFDFVFHKSIDPKYFFLLNFPPIRQNLFHQIFPSEGSQNTYFLKLRQNSYKLSFALNLNPWRRTLRGLSARSRCCTAVALSSSRTLSAPPKETPHT